MKRYTCAAALALLTLTSCGSGHDWNAPQNFDTDEMAAMQRNVRSFCDEHGNRIYWISGRSSQFGVAVQDPTCRQP